MNTWWRHWLLSGVLALTAVSVGCRKSDTEEQEQGAPVGVEPTEPGTGGAGEEGLPQQKPEEAEAMPDAGTGGAGEEAYPQDAGTYPSEP